MGRKASVCQACGLSSWHGRVCRQCRKYWGGTVDNVLAAVALRRELDGATYDQVCEIMGRLVNFVCPDLAGPSLPRLLHSNVSAPPIGGADKKGGV